MLKNLHLDHHNQQNAGCAEFDFFREILCIHNYLGCKKTLALQSPKTKQMFECR